MIRIVSAALLVLVAICPMFAQRSKTAHVLTDEQWQVLLSALEIEDWSAAAEYSLKYMKQLKDEDTEGALPRLRYDYIFACAGKAAAGKLTYGELETALKGFVGKAVEAPSRQMIANCTGGNESMNAICFNSKDHDLTVAATNIRGTTIFAFEYIRLQDKFDFARHQGQWAIMDGTIKSIEINPNVLRIWVMRLFLESAH
ncbi:MAG: hypothetical protein QOJ64_1585, partial [Acidobacteriota bacterium]|nr:hypothetical protein [Acidobacteriota bacterium]